MSICTCPGCDRARADAVRITSETIQPIVQELCDRFGRMGMRPGLYARAIAGVLMQHAVAIADSVNRDGPGEGESPIDDDFLRRLLAAGMDIRDSHNAKARAH